MLVIAVAWLYLALLSTELELLPSSYNGDISNCKQLKELIMGSLDELSLCAGAISYSMVCNNTECNWDKQNWSKLPFPFYSELSITCRTTADAILNLIIAIMTHLNQWW